MSILKELRKFLKKNQSEMATELNVSKSLYSKVESGEREASREFVTLIKKKYPFVDTNIFFTNQNHGKWSNDKKEVK